MLEFQGLLYRYKATDNRIIKLIKISPSMKEKILNDLAICGTHPTDERYAEDTVLGHPIQVSSEVPEDEIWIISPLQGE